MRDARTPGRAAAVALHMAADPGSASARMPPRLADAGPLTVALALNHHLRGLTKSSMFGKKIVTHSPYQESFYWPRR